MSYTNTRLLGRFLPIFHFNCEYVLFMYIVKQKFRGFYKKKIAEGPTVAREKKILSWILKIVKNRIFIEANF